MSVNFGNGYPMMNGGMNPMGGIMGNSENMFQYFKSKYGCDDCFVKQPYLQEYPKPILPIPPEVAHPSFLKRLMNRILG